MTSNHPEPSSSVIFEKNWQRYRTIMANNLMYHREVYRELHRILVEQAPRPFRFLDIACGGRELHGRGPQRHGCG